VNDYIDDRLHSWARWVQSQLSALGFPSADILWNQMRYGTPIDKQGQAPDLEHEDELQTDIAMRKLKDVHQKSHAVLIAKYLRVLPDGKKVPAGMYDKALAARMGLSERKLYHYLERGKDWLAGYLDAVQTHAIAP